MDLEQAIARYEADEEVQDLLTASLGLNLGIDFLPGAFGYDAGLPARPRRGRRGSCGWTRSPPTSTGRGATPTCWCGTATLWAIDHGAALYFHHSWPAGSAPPDRFAAQPYRLDDHVLAAHLAGLPAADAELAPLVTEELLRDVVGRVPEEWLGPVPDADAEAVRAAYVGFLLARLHGWPRVAGRGCA